MGSCVKKPLPEHAQCVSEQPGRGVAVNAVVQTTGKGCQPDAPWPYRENKRIRDQSRSLLSAFPPKFFAGPAFRGDPVAFSEPGSLGVAASGFNRGHDSQRNEVC